MSLSEDRPFEESLIQGCLSNNQAAWTELVDGYNERLLAAARHALGASAHNEDDAEQAVAEVWGFLCEHPKCLADWDHRREDLCAFLSKLVRNRARQLRKKRQRRRLVEGQHVIDPHVEDPALAVWLDEFRNSKLTPCEQDFFDRFMLRRDARPATRSYSPANRRQLRYQICHKASVFFGFELAPKKLSKNSISDPNKTASTRPI